MTINSSTPKLKPLPEPASDWFVNREDELNHFWQWTTSIPHAIPRRSYAITGARRIGKTAIINRLFNRLFLAQTRVMPVYITFAPYLGREKPIDAFEFAHDFFSGYLQSFLAFRHDMPELLHERRELRYLVSIVERVGDEILLNAVEAYFLGREGAIEHPTSALRPFANSQITVPAGIARARQIPTVVFIDEFQVLTRVLHNESKEILPMTNAFQQAAESRWAPLVVSGSSTSMMVEQALGGMVSGRFRRQSLRPLSEKHTIKLVEQLGDYNGIPVNRTFSTAIWEITKGYPYPIEALLNSGHPLIDKLPDEDALKKIATDEIALELGELWTHYDTEYGKVLQLIDNDVTHQVLTWLTKQPEPKEDGDLILADQLAVELDADERSVLKALDMLYKADIITRYGPGYYAIADPMLRRYVTYTHSVQIQKLSIRVATQNLREDYNEKIGYANERVGHLAEIIICDVMKSFDDRQIEGQPYFNIPDIIELHHFIKLQRRAGIIEDGKPIEIDVIGEYNASDGESVGAWMVQVRYKGKKTTRPDVVTYLEEVEKVRADRGYDEVIHWYFSKSGFTEPAKLLLQEEGVYHNDLHQFNDLAQIFGFMGLPK
ncbi:MAG: ATP-binding protein [Chloroflexota bacterium]